MSLQILSLQLMKNFKSQWRYVTSHSYQKQEAPPLPLPSHPYSAVDNIIHATRLSKTFELGLNSRVVPLQKNFQCPNVLPFSGSLNARTAGKVIERIILAPFLFWVEKKKQIMDQVCEHWSPATAPYMLGYLTLLHFCQLCISSNGVPPVIQHLPFRGLKRLLD